MSANDQVISETQMYLRTEFLERLAHELRGPVGVTSGALDEIEIAVGPEDAAAVRPYLLMAKRGMLRVLRIAERLQRTAQLEAGGCEWTMAATDLRPVAEQATRESERLEARRAVRVDLSCSQEECLVALDTPWVHFAIAELVSNAIRFARSNVSVRTEVSTDEVSLTICDDGPGLPVAPPQRFERPSEKRGVGLSLSLARDVVAAHRGRLELDGPRAAAVTLAGARIALVLPRHPRRHP